ncbi:CpsD/CapB family tyrosine-protein kinase [Shimia sp. R10_1]|uniref:CpsD/CapB family tyrosine-protein kinase n=1 Tax=Shimia sp. R10_1 TaxID=2821095 RepID=UPI001AD97BB1|nr:CpsD/CapB family tyrosine-protein kinase [Shimia sp. R10_1]MBO9474039.1 CpsD/CapB family tyrosine-protein kinase [Shimia sp. R10_1]
MKHEHTKIEADCEPADSLPALQDPEVFWNNLSVAAVDDAVLAQNHIISASRSHPAHAAFDMLRTRMLQALNEHGWSRVAVTAPTRGCGSSFVSANLAFALARLNSVRTVLLDLDLRAPSLDKTLGLTAHDTMADYLSGVIAPENFLVKAAPNLALALNDRPEDNSAELFQTEMITSVLEELEETLCADVMLFDMPPALEFDDVLGFLPNVDAVLLVAGGGVSTAEELEKVERIFSGVKPILGVLLNKAEGPTAY